MPDFIARYIGLAAFLVFAIIFKFVITRTGRSQRESKDKLFEDERSANFSRVQAIPEGIMYTPDVSKLPVREYTDEEKKLRLLQERALAAASKPMLRLDPPMTNIEIKRAFGATNLEIMTTREENYELYIRALSNWAGELISRDNYEAAEIILKICIEMNALFFLPYSLLCDVYEKTGNKAATQTLRDYINKTEIIRNNEILFKKISDYIRVKLS